MKPMIYKPGAYKTPGVYKGAGGIYNGRGVYKYMDKYGSVAIGNETYKTLVYNGRVWTVENIRNDIATNYVNWDSKFGRLYKFSDALVTIQNMLPDGWRIPHKSDFDDLISYLGNDYLSYISEDFGGTNLNGFNIPLTGYVSSSGTHNRWDYYGFIWTDTVSQNDPNDRYDYVFGRSTIIPNDTGYADGASLTKMSIRIVKDL